MCTTYTDLRFYKGLNGKEGVEGGGTVIFPLTKAKKTRFFIHLFPSNGQHIKNLKGIVKEK